MSELAKEMETSFVKKNLFQRMSLTIPESEQYYCKLRKYWFEQKRELKNIKLREAFYPLFVGAVALDRIFRKQTIEILGNRKKYMGQLIFACTHIGGDDCQRVFEAIRRGCWWFIGDPGYLYKEVSGLLLHLNGCIMLETGDKTDRNIAYLRAVELLKAGGSIMIYPEGARNGTANLPVMGLFQGTAKMAMETGVKIVPVAIEQYGRRFVVHFGTEILPEDFRNHEELTQKLRDNLATLKWEIWEHQGVYTRNDIADDYGEQFIREFEERIFPYDTLESVERTRYHGEEVSPEKVFAHLEQIEVTKRNAFLFDKRIIGRC